MGHAAATGQSGKAAAAGPMANPSLLLCLPPSSETETEIASEVRPGFLEGLDRYLDIDQALLAGLEYLLLHAQSTAPAAATLRVALGPVDKTQLTEGYLLPLRRGLAQAVTDTARSEEAETASLGQRLALGVRVQLAQGAMERVLELLAGNS
jgi:hypothetical protein